MTDGPRVQLLKKRSGDVRPLMERIGALLVRSSRASFLNQGFGGAKWAPRKTPSILGIVRDLQEGASVLDARFQARPALVATGNLRSSIHYVVSGAKTVEVRAADYGALHQSGGTGTVAVTDEVKANLKQYLRAHKEMRPRLGFLFRRSQVSATVPARPFLGVPAEGGGTTLLERTRQAIKDIASSFFTLRKGARMDAWPRLT